VIAKAYCPSSGVSNHLLCTSGQLCDTTTGLGWNCCSGSLGTRKACPPEKPIMCAQKTCGPNGDDYCCDFAKVNPCYGTMLKTCV
jgi:hypothetical protein